MERKYIQFACSLDCFDGCAFTAEVLDGEVVRIEGNQEHPLTKGYVCKKGAQHLERMYHPERILRPLKKVGTKWQEISWDDALEEISDKLKDIRSKDNTLSVLHYYDSGYGGISKMVDKMFFNYYGSITVPRGSLCWGAGIAAQQYDFGESRGHHPRDHLHAKTILLWGRNPHNTNIHLMEYLTQAKKQGTKIVLIDPIQTKSAQVATEHIGVKPGTDGALALGMAHCLIEQDMVDHEFIHNHVIGYENFKDYVKTFTPERVADITGVDADTIYRLAAYYGKDKPSCIILGYGLQRYSNGGNTVRCIDALGAITGNIGISGGGVNYANRLLADYIGGEVPKSAATGKKHRSFSRAFFGQYLEEENEFPIKAVFVTKANPLVQGPNLERMIRAFKKIEYKVVFDMFMTDTGKQADLFIPCTHVMEEDDIFLSSMFTPYLNYSQKAVEPRAGIIGEYEFFRALAKKMDLEQYPDIEKDEFLRRAVKPLEDAFQITFEDLKKTFFTIPYREIAWSERNFSTPSGKYELYSRQAEQDGLSPLPQYIPAMEGAIEYPLRLITPHPKDSLHSQHFAFKNKMPNVYINEATANKYGLKQGDFAKITTKQGSLLVKVEIDNNVGIDLLMIYEGWWHQSGSVNLLTEALISDMGEQAAYYDCFCNIKPEAL
ncbi:molybdopterin-containing oxidoreductase family protein [Geosporobacter ferrireducens]|uniref:molybdopterin-containing oxidoreductase family protein n=1 Tax=Geosporobacter ferrireducens TaxID=1424294 RepID=UPI00139D1504|nr:molybdopterin-dependent oxidoreductase [Geosporobacter ferrireducens]MTI54849.1 hypothetical protein [Geosporobacter ferrireducens]